MWPIAVIRCADLTDSNAAKAAGHPRAVQARRANKLGAGQRPFVCAGNRPNIAAGRLAEMLAEKLINI